MNMRAIGIVKIAMHVAYRKHVSIAEATSEGIVSANRATMAATMHINAQSVQQANTKPNLVRRHAPCALQEKSQQPLAISTHKLVKHALLVNTQMPVHPAVLHAPPVQKDHTDKNANPTILENVFVMLDGMPRLPRNVHAVPLDSTKQALDHRPAINVHWEKFYSSQALHNQHSV